MAFQRRKRFIKETLLLVGEGFSEKAFLSLLKTYFSNGNYKISVVTAKGKGPSNVIDHAISTKRHNGHNYCLALLDTDLPWPKSKVQNAEKEGVTLVPSTPCLEGLILKIMNRRVPTTNNECKDVVHPLLKGAPCDRESYERLLSKEIIEDRMIDIPELKSIVDKIRG
ncbi:hypothetical protein B3C1_15889 [Gallaecimonas xiamenensis 3-C-1]|uniref:RloB domain-containing protein n=2 Tax=Gallaecimonas TaxID=745410 RepID=K2JVD2_9GAMM|nr:hypothetical protein B3C1_15889 [Gallaecimonas xiamenensis 3-C-1]